MGADTSAPVRVMLVEDDAATRARFEEVLSRDDRVELVCAVSTARDAIAYLSAIAPDALLVDLGLPDMHGTEVIRAARRLCPQCDALVITMFGDESNVVASIEAGATGYVLKDIGPDELVETILQLKAGGAPMSPGIARLVLNRMRTQSAPRAAAVVEPDTDLLTQREIDVLSALSRGYTYAEIADRLGISRHTVTSHIKNSYRKLSVHSAAAAVTRAAELGLLNNGETRED